MRLRGLHGAAACLRSADPADVVVPHMAVGGNLLRASSPTAGFAPNNRCRQQGFASRAAYRSQDGAKPTCYKGGQTRTRIAQRTTASS